MPLKRSARAAALGLGAGLVLASTVACSGSDPDDTAEESPSSSTTSAAPTTSEPTEPSGSATTDPTGSPETAPPDTASTGEALPPVDGEPCTADVTLSGAVASSWEGEGVVAEDGAYGPTVTYQSTHEDHGVTLVAAGEGFDAAAYLTSGDAFFGSVPGSGDVQIDPAGGGAQVDVELVAPELEGDPVRLVATFTC